MKAELDECNPGHISLSWMMSHCLVCTARRTLNVRTKPLNSLVVLKAQWLEHPTNVTEVSQFFLHPLLALTTTTA